MTVNIDKMTAEIDLMKNATYIVKDGKLETVPIPPTGYGKQIINWQAGKPCNGELSSSFKF
ncbi:DUF3954 domain-containing protein [Metabacillus fastidiosus]|uniref:DUF3954 domain-containing protein n=1 Tax=Metabacillus fastidiosus TaxID=1458 RepID=UPI003D289D9B